MIADRNQILHALPIIDETAHLGQQNGGKIQDRRHLYGREHCHVVRFEKKMWNKLTQCRVCRTVADVFACAQLCMREYG